MTVELTDIERQKINACIMLQVLEAEKQADKLDRLDTLTEAEAATLYELKQRATYYRTLAKKIYAP